MRGSLARACSRVAGTAAAALAAAAIVPAAASADTLTTDAAAQASSTIVEQPVSFTVVNSNRTQIPCTSDNGTYTVKGTLVSPTSRFSRGHRAITLVIHGLTAGGNFFWRLKSVPGYDFARA